MSIINRLIAMVLTFSIIMGSFLLFVQSLDYHINLNIKDCTNTYHTYKMYNTGIDAILDRNPIKECKIPIMSNGNYYGNPTPLEMEQWLSACSYDPNWFDYHNIK